MSGLSAFLLLHADFSLSKVLLRGCIDLKAGDVFEAFDVGSREKLRSFLKRASTEGEAQESVELVADVEGEQRLMQVTVCPFDDRSLILLVQDGKDESFQEQLALMSIMQQQSTNIRRVERERAKFQRLYEDAVQDMTKLNNTLVTMNREELKQKKRLSYLNQQLNDILGMTAHDIRNALLRIQGFSKLLSETFGASEGDGDQAEIILRIHESGEEALLLLNDILDISRIESGNLRLKKSLLNLGEVVHKAMAHNKVLAGNKHLELVAEVGGAKVLAMADENRILQVLGNFLSNAIKFSRSGEKITLGVEQGLEWSKVWVQDRGFGMDEEHLQAIRSGKRVDGREGTLGEKSNGLGLAICKKVIEAHGGALEIDSTQGEGSRFTILLPVPMVQELPQEDGDVGEKSSLQGNQKLPNEWITLDKVAIVDDQKLNLSLLKLTLKGVAREVLAFTDPTEVLENGQDYDLLITDQEMPGLKGTELASKMKDRVRRSILLTAHDFSEEEAASLMALGVDHILQKPLSKEKLLKILRA